MISWMVHSEVLIDPNFSLSWLVETDHSVSDGSWNDNSDHIRISSQSVVQKDSRLLLVQSVYLMKEEWDWFSEDANVLLSSTETEAGLGNVGTENLNPVGGAFSSVINVDFLFKVEFLFHVKVVEISLLSSLASHHFVKSWFLNFLPFFCFILEAFCFRVTATHSLVINFKIIRFYWFYHHLNKFLFLIIKVEIHKFIFNSHFFTSIKSKNVSNFCYSFLITIFNISKGPSVSPLHWFNLEMK